ncbi:c-type cytochrome [Chlorobium phaeobacteroides]|uniref:C-type cytochrome, putative n=1 Tax=Chlorobium phaeobacteroides (strain DSM 266 / SMG 266 / 2430) TaxID=290317 RepID=A1BCW1_CHLPD|nr:cytochrome c [Chlorobium phaeobacteroides]ABL64238.1 C-type cytochrome, putative [Chlorobium phaeobacteroides DSM 266]
MKRVFIGLVTGLLCFPVAQSRAATPDGKEVFERNCSVCHSVNPPSKSAPPILPISGRYHMQFSTKSAGVAAMAAFMKAPSKQKSVIEPEAITRFGLMPPMALGDAELTAVAGWVWDQGGSASGRGSGRGAGQGAGGCN